MEDLHPPASSPDTPSPAPESKPNEPQPLPTTAEPPPPTIVEPAAPDPPSPPSSTTVADVLQHATAFLSTAGPETLAATGLAIASILYMIFGSLGLLVVGIVVGAVGHASLTLHHPPTTTADPHSTWQHRHTTDLDRTPTPKPPRRNQTPDFSSLPPETAKALDELTDAAVRDYVRWWYAPLLPGEDSFPGSCRSVLVETLVAMHTHVARKRAADTLMLFLISASNTFVVFLRELALVNQRGVSVGEFLAEEPGSALAQMVDRVSQGRRLKMAADDVVQSFCGREVLQCEPVRVFLTEMLAGVALEMTVEKCAQRDWINGMIVYLLEEETQPELLREIDLGDTKPELLRETDTGDTKPGDRRVSRAQEEMKKAMEEAEELTRLIAEEEEERKRMSTIGSNGALDEKTNGASNDDRISLDTPPSVRESLQVDPADVRTENVPQFSPPPKSTTPPASQPPPSQPRDSFVSFDQLVLPQSDPIRKARVLLSDLTPPAPGPEKPLRSKPTTATYLLQIEPSSTSTPGWIVTRKLADFETLHEVLRRISAVSGLEHFQKQHYEMPSWKGVTMSELRDALEAYLNDALSEQVLSESEGMKRFLEKDTADAPAAPKGFAAIGKGFNPTAFAKMGQGALDALAKAPQGVAEGGKGLFGGMKKAFTPPTQLSRTPSSTAVDEFTGEAQTSSLFGARRNSSAWASALGRRDSSAASRDSIAASRDAVAASRDSFAAARESFAQESPEASLVSLPPPPEEMPDDYNIGDPFSDSTFPRSRRPSIPVPPSPYLPDQPLRHPTPPPRSPSPDPESSVKREPKPPLTPPETHQIMELIFALLSELYTLSSAWTLRRSLLTLAKNIFLRPNNPSLAHTQQILQNSVIDENLNDAAVAGWVRSIKDGVFSEGKQAEVVVVDGVELQRRARELFCKKGVPEALRGVMGAMATEEALGVVFECLQDREVARAVVAGLVLEGVRGVCQ